MKWTTTGCCFALLLTTACGGGGGGNPDGGGGGGLDAAFCPVLPDGGVSGAATGDVTGTWAIQSKTLAQVQGLGGAQLAMSSWLLEVTQTGTDLAVVETMCSLKIDSVNGNTKVRVTPSYITAVPPENRTGSVVDDGSGGFTVTLDENYIVRGATLTDEINDSLPTDAGDPRVGDWDMDGNPGVTLLIDGVLSGKAYVVQRDHNQYTGTQVDADRVEGRVVWGSEQNYMGSDPPEIAKLGSQAFPDPDPSKHTFVMIHLDDGADCAFVVANSCSLFPE